MLSQRSQLLTPASLRSSISHMHLGLGETGEGWEQTIAKAPSDYYLPLQSCSQLNVPFHLVSPLFQAFQSGSWITYLLDSGSLFCFVLGFCLFCLVLFLVVPEIKLRALHALGKAPRQGLLYC